MTKSAKRHLTRKLLASTIVLAYLSLAVMSQVRSPGPNDIPERYGFSGEKPRGLWSVGAVPDLRQVKDAVTPVVVTGTSSLIGKDRWAGALKLVSVKLTNRSGAPTPSTKFEDDRVHVIGRARFVP